MTDVIAIDPLGAGKLSLRPDGQGGDSQTYLVGGLPRHVSNSRWRAARARGLPREGQRHPHHSSWVVTGIEVGALEPGFSDTRRVTVQWGPPPATSTTSGDAFGAPQWSFDIRTVTEQTQRDHQGNLMVLTYTGSPVIESIDLTTGEVFTRSVGGFYRAAKTLTAEIDTAILGLRCTRIERTRPSTARIQKFFNATNRDRVLNAFDRGTLQMDGISAEQVNPSSANPGGWRVTYVMSWRKQGWKYTEGIEIGNQIPQDATEGNGIATYRIFPEERFAPLRLRWQ